MSKKTSRESQSRDQWERFKETARELGADEDEERFNERLKRIAKQKPKRQPEGAERSKKDES